MPKRTDLHTILVLGSGPIVIGQACEFDYAGVQAIKALRGEGYRVVLVNPNPATIMTDSGLASQVYLAPLTVDELEAIIIKERPDALLPTMGGQTALNCALALAEAGVLTRYQVALIGADLHAIRMAEDRELFRQAMGQIGLTVARSAIARSVDEALLIQTELGFPLVVRPSYTLGGSGGGIAYHRDELIQICRRGFALSPNHEVLLEESLLGWQEFELEVVRDKADNTMIVCSIENVDPVGVHTGDSITVAPQQTLPDREYQQLRHAAMAIMRVIGVDTGGANVQFAVNPQDGRMCVIEMNPRVSRSSALASKATGFPIAKIAALLAVGYTLPELANDMTGGRICAAFEPTLDYIVTKVPRFQFHKFKDADDRLGTQMKSIGESMAMGRSFAESLQKALVGLDEGGVGLDSILPEMHLNNDTMALLQHELQCPGPKRIYYLADALRLGMSIAELATLTQIHPWFIADIAQIIAAERDVVTKTLSQLSPADWHEIKRLGMTDAALAKLWQQDEATVSQTRRAQQVTPCFWQVDTCAAEFPASTAYLYATYGGAHQESVPSERPKVLILGSGPNRIGQGIEFDYCCVHAAQSLRALGFEVLMQNNNPETVSTDYDVADKLYVEPITREAVLSIADVEQPDAILAQYGGQTPLRLAQTLEQAGYTLLGTNAAGIALAEDRACFSKLVTTLGLLQPAHQTITDIAAFLAEPLVTVAFPLLARPSYVLGGQSMVVLTHQSQLITYLRDLTKDLPSVSVQLDHYLQGAVEFDVEALVTPERVQVVAIIEHVDPAGVHSGDSAMLLPAQNLTAVEQQTLITYTKMVAQALGVIGLLNLQFAKHQDAFYLLEANPRAARTVPLIAKAFHIPLAHLGILAMVSALPSHPHTETLTVKAKQALNSFFNDIDSNSVLAVSHDIFVKLAVFPFDKFLTVDPWLGPEMRSTGEVMCSGPTVPDAFCRALRAAQVQLPCLPLRVLLSVNTYDKAHVVKLGQRLQALGATLFATAGTHALLAEAGISAQLVNRLSEARPHVLDLLENQCMNWLILTTDSAHACEESATIRRFAKTHGIYMSTSLAYANHVVGVYTLRH